MKAVSDVLTNASFDKQTEKEVFIQSDDTAVLSTFKGNPNYKRVFMIEDQISTIPVPSIAEIKQYADAVNINRFSVTKTMGFFLTGMTPDISFKQTLSGICWYQQDNWKQR